MFLNMDSHSGFVAAITSKKPSTPPIRAVNAAFVEAKSLKICSDLASPPCSCGSSRKVAKETEVLPSLWQLYERTHKNKGGQFLDARSEQIFNDLVGRVEDRQTQLTQQSTDGLPVTLFTSEVDKIYEEVNFLKF